MSELREAIRRAPDDTRARLAKAIEETTFAVAARARALAPRDTGTLAREISSSARGLNGRVTIGPDAYYWRFVEYGTKHQAARPFIRTATESESVEFEHRIRSVASELQRDFNSGRLI